MKEPINMVFDILKIFIFGTLILAPFIYLQIHGGTLTINIDRPYLNDYNTLVVEHGSLMNRYDTLIDEKKVLCEYKRESYFFPLIIGFFTGAFSIGYFIMVGYPWLRRKLDENYKVHKRKKR